MIVNQIEQRVYVGFSSSKRKISRLWIGEGENSRTGGWILRFARARFGGRLTALGKLPLAFLGEVTRRASVAWSGWFRTGARRQLLARGDVTFEWIGGVKV